MIGSSAHKLRDVINTEERLGKNQFRAVDHPNHFAKKYFWFQQTNKNDWQTKNERAIRQENLWISKRPKFFCWFETSKNWMFIFCLKLHLLAHNANLSKKASSWSNVFFWKKQQNIKKRKPVCDRANKMEGRIQKV